VLCMYVCLVCRKANKVVYNKQTGRLGSWYAVMPVRT